MPESAVPWRRIARTSGHGISRKGRHWCPYYVGIRSSTRSPARRPAPRRGQSATEMLPETYIRPQTRLDRAPFSCRSLSFQHQQCNTNQCALFFALCQPLLLTGEHFDMSAGRHRASVENYRHAEAAPSTHDQRTFLSLQYLFNSISLYLVPGTWYLHILHVDIVQLCRSRRSKG